MYNLVQTGHVSKEKKPPYAKSYFKKRLKRINEILFLQPGDFPQEIIHELRLEIKKLKALFLLLDYCNGDFPRRKFYEPFKKIFEKAGDVRIIQIEQGLLKKYISDSSDRYLQQLRKLEREKRKALEKMIKSDTIAKMENNKKKIIPFLESVSEKDVRHFLKANARELTALIDKKIFTEQNLHLIRKELKSFYFIARTTYNDITIPGPWNRLVELLGEWHDDQVAIEHLRKVIYSSVFDQNETNRLLEVKRKITDHRENLFDQIIASHFLIESKENSTTVPDNSLVDQIQ